MPIASAEMRAGYSYKLSKPNTGFSPTVAKSTKARRLLPGTAFDQVLSTRLSIPSAGDQTLDLSSFTNEVGETVTATKAVGILVLPNGSDIRVEADGTNGLPWFLTGTSPAVNIPPGGFFAYGEPVGTTVDGTHKRILFTNTGDTDSTVDVVIFVKD